MTRPTQDDVIKLVLGAFAVGVAWAVLSAAVSGKVDRLEFRDSVSALRSDVREGERTRQAVDSVQRDVRAIRCHLQPQTIGCARMGEP